MSKKEYYAYLFHYNPHTGLWNCFLREALRSYFNGSDEYPSGSGKTVDEAYNDLTGDHSSMDKHLRNNNPNIGTL